VLLSPLLADFVRDMKNLSEDKSPHVMIHFLGTSSFGSISHSIRRGSGFDHEIGGSSTVNGRIRHMRVRGVV